MIKLTHVVLSGSKNTSRAASHAKSAPPRGAGLKNVNPRKAAKMEKSYNMLRRPTDKVLVGSSSSLLTVEM